MKTYSFARGGIVYRDDRAPFDSAGRIAYLPTIAVVPMLQHEGVPAIPLVSIGESIREGMVVGRSASRTDSVIHAPIPGTIVKSVVWRMPDGRNTEALVVKLEGSFDKLGKRQELFSWNGMSAPELQRLIAERGVVEMDGSGRSLFDLLAKMRQSEERTLLVANAVFDDPWLAAERAVLSERAEAVAEGIEIVMKASEAASVALAATAESRGSAAQVVERLAAKGLDVRMAVLGSKYPQRNLRELDCAMRSFGKSADLDYDKIVPMGMSTLAAVYDAVRRNQPLVERYVAVGGDAVKNPAVLRVRIGTRIGDAIAECGGFIEDPERVILGSPLTGYAVSDLDTPITKTTGAVVAVGKLRVGGTAVRSCIGCGNCREVCPVGLDPERLYKLSILARYAEVLEEGAGDCHGCACCAAVCPSRLPLRATIRIGAERGGTN